MPLSIAGSEVHCRFCKQHVHTKIICRGESCLSCLNRPSHTNIVPLAVALVVNCYSYRCDQELWVRCCVGSLSANFPLQFCQCSLILIFSCSSCYFGLRPPAHHVHHQAPKHTYVHAWLCLSYCVMVLFQLRLPKQSASITQLWSSPELIAGHKSLLASSSAVQSGRGHNAD